MVKTMKLLPVLLFTATLCAQTWTPQTSNTRASLRGVSAVDARTVWASGSGGTYLVDHTMAVPPGVPRRSPAPIRSIFAASAPSTRAPST